MVNGTPQDNVVTIESNSSYEFTYEINLILGQEPLFYVETCFIDAHVWQAILLKEKEK